MLFKKREFSSLIHVVSWTNHKQCRESRSVVESINELSVLQVNSFVEKAYVSLATEHMRDGAKKKQRDASP